VLGSDGGFQGTNQIHGRGLLLGVGKGLVLEGTNKIKEYVEIGAK
jgi:hypothetical protein